MVDPMHFDRYAELYESARPPYPEALWERLGGLGLLATGSRALDLGAGTGQATRVLVQRGMDVTAVEPGPALARLLRERVPEARVLQTTAEDAELAPASFDLVTIATAVHWFDLPVVLPQLHAALTAGGHLAVWRNVYGDSTIPPTPFRVRVGEIVGRRDPRPRPVPGESATAEWAVALTAGGYFEVEHVEEFPWRWDPDEDQIRSLFTTFSDWSEAEAEEAAQAVRELGGVVAEHYLTPLIVLRRVDRES
jgi:SAM-dependent methyltransferase